MRATCRGPKGVVWGLEGDLPPRAALPYAPASEDAFGPFLTDGAAYNTNATVRIDDLPDKREAECVAYKQVLNGFQSV